MKRIVWITFCFAFVITEHLTAQDLFWGTSSHPDPITRHNKALFLAFQQYAVAHNQQTGSSITGTCSLEIVSDSIKDGRETICLSISEGKQLSFEYQEMTNSIGSAEETEILSRITLRLENTGHSSVHIYAYEENYKKKSGQESLHSTKFYYTCGN
ncbi:MAG: hypothetical protein J1E02_08240 [Coprobacter sp.]|nr:hypothetical protein [Coprobacter sp.]